MKFSRFVGGMLAVALLMAMVLPTLPAAAQTDAPPVLILPIDKAEFLPGAFFDIRIEVHAAELPADFKATINGEDLSKFFGVEAVAEKWEFGSKDKPTPSNANTWRKVKAPAAGEYKVEVTAGGKTHTVNWTVRKPMAGTAKNVILFIGDGMSVPLITATRVISRGIKEGTPKGRLSFEGFEAIGLASTSSVDSLMADSANTASTLNTGHIGSVNATGTYSDTSPDTLDDPRTETLAQMLKRLRGYAIGVVTTADISDATPAAVWAHGRNRSDLNRNTYVLQALEQKIDVLMGGGARRFIPKGVEGSRRADEVDVFKGYEEAGYKVVTSKTELTDAMKSTPKQLLGIFHPSDMNVWLDRNVFTDNLGDLKDQPGLVDMTVAALDILKQNPNGFYLEVEAASIDKQLHSLDIDRTLADIIELDRAVAAAIEWAKVNAPDTLIVVTADHGHGFDVYGTVDVAKFNAATDNIGKRNAIRVYSAAKYPTYEDKDGDFFPDDWAPSIVMAATVNNHPDYTEDFQVSKTPRVPAKCEAKDNAVVCLDNPDDDPNGIPMNGNLDVASGSGVHTLQDVPVYASGPGASFFARAYHQKEIFFGMAAALGLDPSAPDGKVAAAATEPAKVAAAGVAFPSEFSALLLVVLGLAVGFAARSVKFARR